MAQYSIMIFFLILCEKLSAMATFSKSQIAFKNTVYIPIVFLQVLNVFPEVPFFPCFLLSFHNLCWALPCVLGLLSSNLYASTTQIIFFRSLDSNYSQDMPEHDGNLANSKIIYLKLLGRMHLTEC